MNIVESIRQRVANCKHSDNAVLRFVYTMCSFLYSKLVMLYLFVVDGDYRYVVYLRLFKAGEIHQTTTLTAVNRYPEVFSSTREFFEDDNKIRILSYGCSTGEEVVTLRKYFPNAEIIGADINKNCLDQCRKKKLDSRIRFICSTDGNIRKNGPYDAIFCMAVLQREPHSHLARRTKNIKNIYEFSKFDQQLKELDRSLNENGLLIVHFTQYLVTESSISVRYKPYGNVTQEKYIAPIYDRNGDMLVGAKAPNSIFMKVGA